MGNTLCSKKKEEVVESNINSTVPEKAKTEKVESVESSTKPEDKKSNNNIYTNDNEPKAKDDSKIESVSTIKDTKTDSKKEEASEKDTEDQHHSKDDTEPVTVDKTSESTKESDAVEEKSNHSTDENDNIDAPAKQTKQPNEEDAALRQEPNGTKATTDGTSIGETLTAGVKRKDSPVTANDVDAKIDGKAKRAKVHNDENKSDASIENVNGIETSSSKNAVVA